jgi:hypothetical protein
MLGLALVVVVEEGEGEEVASVVVMGHLVK